MEKFFRSAKEKLSSGFSRGGGGDGDGDGEKEKGGKGPGSGSPTGSVRFQGVTQGNLRVVMVNMRGRTSPNTVLQTTRTINRRGLLPRQTAMMGQMVQEALNNPGDRMDDTVSGDPGATFQAEDGPVFLVRNDTRDWDTIYQAGGLMARGNDTDVMRHVGYDRPGTSAYVAGSDSSHVFDSSSSWAYLYVTLGAVDAHNPMQHEKVTIGGVSIREIYMFRHNAYPNRIFINQSFYGAGLDMNPQLEQACIDMLINNL